MLEQTIQKKIINYLNSIGCYVIKSIVASRSGVPDIICCLNGRFVTFEVKREDGRASELQKYNMTQIQKAGGSAYIVRSVEEVAALIPQIN